MGVDTLSDVLRSVRLTGAVFFDIDTRAPWVAEAPPAREIAGSVLPGVQHVIEYHVVTSGTCYGGLIGEPPIKLEAGDVIVFPHGDAHVMSSEPGMRGQVDYDVFKPPPQLPIPIMFHAGPEGPREANIVCGFLGCDLTPFNPLIASLPRVLHDSAGCGPRDNWLAQFVRYAVVEAREGRAGGACMLTKMSELMFVEVLRRYLESLPEGRMGWLSGLRDPQIGRALASLHERPAHDWTLEELARSAAMSRSALAERFNEVVGSPPMQYLAQWRMQLASTLLAQGERTLPEIARDVGYQSEAAFSRAFKKVVGASPGSWRRRSNGHDMERGGASRQRPDTTGA
jgi:AraC-like DNA-binding protein